MTIDDFLSRLRAVKRTGHGKWIASCPTREDKNPSMSIRLLNDGRILIHDFGGSNTEEILNAMDLSFSDLYPEPLFHHSKKTSPFSGHEVLLILKSEIRIVYLFAKDVANGKALMKSELERLLKSISRLNYCIEMANGK